MKEKPSEAQLEIYNSIMKVLKEAHLERIKVKENKEAQDKKTSDQKDKEKNS